MKKEMVEDDERVECHYNGSVFYIPTKIFMEAVFATQIGRKLFVRYKTGAQLFDVSERTFTDIAKEADAIHKRNSGLAFIDPEAVSRYIRTLPPE